MELTIQPLKKLILKAGAKRVSKDACIELAKVLEGKTIKTCKKADELAKYSGRRTVMKRDIRFATKDLK